MEPSLEEQARRWNAWNLESDRGEYGGDPDYCRRVAALTEACAARAFGPLARTEAVALEVGCGTGWLCRALARCCAEVWGTDLSPEAIEVAQRRQPAGHFVAADFTSVELGAFPRFDLVVSCEAVAHVADQAEFFRRCRSLTRTGGRLLLFSQNPFTWSRSSYLAPPPAGHLRHWPTREELDRHFTEAGYRLVSIQTIFPHGDRGLLVWRPYANGILRRLVGRRLNDALWERLGLGRTLVVEAVAF